MLSAAARLATRRLSYKASKAIKVTKPPQTLFLLHYDYVPDILTKRTPFRDGHLSLAEQMKADGKLLMAGAVGEVDAGPTTAQFVMTSLDAVTEFTANDPYIPGGCVTAQSIKQWTVAVHDLKDKKKLSNYILWLQKEGRAMVKEENPEATFGEISKLAGAKWREMSASDKEMWKAA